MKYFMRIGANGALLFTLLIYAAVICIGVRIIKYFIRLPYQGRWHAVGVTERLYEGKPARGLGQ